LNQESLCNIEYIGILQHFMVSMMLNAENSTLELPFVLFLGGFYSVATNKEGDKYQTND